MATEETLRVISCNTGADLSTHQYKGVKYVPGSVNTVILVSAITDTCVGILQDAPLSSLGRGVAVGVNGGSKVVCGASVAAGDRFCFDSTGRAITVASATAYAMGVMREAGTVGTIASCIIAPSGTG